MSDIILEKLNEVFFRVHADFAIIQELKDYLTFKVPGYKFMPAYKNKLWNGDKCLVNKGNTVYLGLLDHVLKFSKRSNYSVEVDEKLVKTNNFTEEFIKKFITHITPEGTNLTVRDYQEEAIISSIQNQRQINLACTGAGKSAIIYYISRFYTAQKKKVIVIVPTVSLVEQLVKDFADYAKGTWNVERKVQKIYSGFSKDISAEIVVSTWQSIFKAKKEWLNQFHCAIFDEAHLYSAAQVSGMIEKMTEVPVKLGTTGTLDHDNKKVHMLVLTGLIGPEKVIARSRDLIDRGFLSEISIKMLILKYPEEERVAVKNLKYQDELDYIVTHKKRNNVITQLALKCPTVTLVLFQFVEKHGKVLYEKIKAKAGDRPVYFIHGEVDGRTREDIRQIIIKSPNAIVVASTGTFSTGINIPNLEYLIFASPSKSKIKNLQSIGRILRKTEASDKCYLYDIADDFSYKSKINTTMKHATERLRIYTVEEFEYKVIKVDM